MNAGMMIDNREMTWQPWGKLRQSKSNNWTSERYFQSGTYVAPHQDQVLDRNQEALGQSKAKQVNVL
jgi:hypothetical protein